MRAPRPDTRDRVASYNVGDGPLEAKARDIRALIAAGAIIIGLQEASDRRGLRRKLPDGWACYWPTMLAGAAAVPILWDDRKLALCRMATILAVLRMWVGPKGAGPTFAKPKRLNYVVLEDRETGERIRAVCCHFLPSAGRHDLPDPEREARRWHYLHMAKALADLIDRLNGPHGHRVVVVMLDANAEHDFPLLAPVRATRIDGWTKQGTHGGRAIDHVLGLSGDRTTLELSSDHRAVLARL